MPGPEHYSVKFRFGTLEEAVDFFHDVRKFRLVPLAQGVRLQELGDVDPPGEDTRLIVADAPSPDHRWIVPPEGSAP